MTWLAGAALGLVALLALAWGGLALHFDGPRGYGDALAVAWTIAALAAFALVRPVGRGLVVFGVLLGVLALWWSSLRPSNDRDWMPDVARPPRGELHGDLLTLQSVRNFDYRSESDFTERWETRTLDLAKLARLDLFMSYWGSPALAHTILSWAFTDGQHLAVSIETRKEVGETYSPVAGFFKQYELYYVVADERDVIRLRTNYRGEEVHLYPLRTPVDRARSILLDYVATINDLADRPVWYNAATHNCTSAIRTHVQHIGISMPFDWRLLATGYADQLLYERGVIAMQGTYDEVRARSRIDERAKAADQDPRFSERIRDGITPPATAS